MIYITYFLFSLLIIIFLKKTRQARLLILILTILIFIMAYPGGNDWLGYFRYYDCIWNSRCVNGNVYFEPGYTSLVKLFGFGGFYLLNIFVFIFAIFPLYSFSKNFDNPSIFLVLYLSLFLWVLIFEAVRQAIAMSVILFALKSIYERNISKFLTLVLLASLFHSSASIFILMLIPYMSQRVARSFVILAVIFSFSFFALYDEIANAIIHILPDQNPIANKINFYFSTEEYKPKLSIGTGAIFDLILLFSIFITIKTIKKRREYFDNNMSYINSLTIFGIIIYLCLAVIIGKVMPVMTRVGWYYFPFVIIGLYTNIGCSFFYPEKLKPHKFRQVILFAIALFAVVQVSRPLMYDISRFNILNQKTIFTNLENLTDDKLRLKAKEKCETLYKLGAGFLCTI